MNVAVIGCGKMGAAMASRLVSRGHQVICYDAAAKRRIELAEKGLSVADTALAAMETVDLAILSLPRAEIVRKSSKRRMD